MTTRRPRAKVDRETAAERDERIMREMGWSWFRTADATLSMGGGVSTATLRAASAAARILNRLSRTRRNP